MKINAFRNNDPKFTANLWRVKISTGVEGENHFSYTFNRAITLTANTGSFGKLDVWLPEDCADVVALDQLQQLTGPDGKELATAGVWQFDVIAPYLNMWGHREGFKARISMVAVIA